MVRRRGPPGLEAGLACLDRRLVVTSARGRDTVRVVHQDARVCSSFAKAQEVVYQRLSSLFFAPTTSARTLHGTRAGSPHARLSCPVQGVARSAPCAPDAAQPRGETTQLSNDSAKRRRSGGRNASSTPDAWPGAAIRDSGGPIRGVRIPRRQALSVR